MTITHRELCVLAAKYLKNNGIIPFQKAKYVVCELERQGESPDAFGFGYCTQLIEVKVSRSDFLSDKKKYWRKYPQRGLGMYRSYLCPSGMINVEELPDGWGLLYYDNGKIDVVKKPEEQESCHRSEIALISSILRREGIASQIFSYKKYKKKEQK